MKDLLTFNASIGRLAYLGYLILFYLILAVTIGICNSLVTPEPVVIIVAMCWLYTSIAVLVARAKDLTNGHVWKSVVLVLCGFVPILNIIVGILLLFAPKGALGSK